MDNNDKNVCKLMIVLTMTNKVAHSFSLLSTTLAYIALARRCLERVYFINGSSTSIIYIHRRKLSGYRYISRPNSLMRESYSYIFPVCAR